MASARCAASTCAVRASSLCMRPISLLTRFNAAANTCFAARDVRPCPESSRSRRPFPACLAALLARQSPLLVAHIAQPLAQRLEIIEPDIIDSGMMTAQDDLMLIVAENAAFEFAR